MKTLLKGISTFIILTSLTVFVSGQEYNCKEKNEQFRKDKNTWIVQHENKPFSQSDIASFNGLFYYDINCKWVMNGTLSVAATPKVIKVETTKGTTVQLYDYGMLSLDIGGEQYNLQVYKNIDLPEFAHAPETVFIPIKDGTSGVKPKTTFANGRYLVIEPPASGDQVVVDFNRTINPFENYNSAYPSLLVPDGNVIKAPLVTGERKYEDR